jgi:dipeptidyl aminopeptidase/acylaminoacyl peptidase
VSTVKVHLLLEFTKILGVTIPLAQSHTPPLSTMAESSTRLLTADMLAKLEIPHEVKLSPSAKQAVYTLRSDWNRPRGRWVSSLWIAEVGNRHSARQLTLGDSNDSWPQFSPDGNSIAFLSDRATEGITVIWLLDLRGGDAIPLTSTDHEKSVSKFAWSTDGRYIAYLSADERTDERKAKDERKDDSIVYGQDWGYSRLRIVGVTTKEVTTLVSENCHVYEFAFGPDSKSVAYATTKTPEMASADANGTSIEILKLDDRSVVKLSTFPGPVEDLCWISSDIWWRGMYDLTSVLSSKAVYKLEVSTKKWNRQAFGEKDCASTWAFPPGLRRASETSLVVQVQAGLADQLHILSEGTVIYDELHEIKSFDAASKEGKMVLAIVKSSGDSPSELYSIVGGETIPLSSHGKDIAKLDLATAEPFYAKAQDGTDLDGVLVLPKKYKAPKPWPTIVLVHGGPYQRASCGFDLPFFNLSSWFASAGYAVLCVNYRGGSSHGSAYATSIRGIAGTFEYSDTIDLVKAGITRGIIDPDRVGISGWSYGGYITFLAVTRDSTFHFQGAIAGAGITDWDLMLMTCPEDHLWNTEVAGYAPWGVDQRNTGNRAGSPIWHMQDIKTPILILHGENDDSVPLSQAKAFYQGCLVRGAECEMVVYPREGHAMFPPFERGHYIDLLERTRSFWDKHLLKAV